MAYLAKALKDDLKTLAIELGLKIGETMRVIDFKSLIIISDEKEELSKTKARGTDFRTRTHEDLVLTDQLKRRVLRDVKEHFVDIWGDIKSSSELVQKLDDYDIVCVLEAKEAPRKSFGGHSQFESRTPLPCYGCGKPGYIKSKCPDCNPSKSDPAHFGILQVNSLSPSNRNTVLRISINGASRTAFADSGASYSIAGEILYSILLQQGTAFEKTAISLFFADGIVTQKEVLRTFQTILMEGRKFKTLFIILLDAKNNFTLLGFDFLENAGLVLNFRKNCWTFCDDSQKSYNFVTPYQSIC
ncbi:transposon Tf2-6 polyprotein [Trichonephila inaurata madagascariensis]|uniref:Transposon Tf2-6 polyprotein n=1 Tax=Trichonephila inaurata madagascariensis TaxID=2747483 RepID=A0A8X6X0R1_9ARAC|nr:transposon Tf2-6 polyprotein [Trichonephila inaurata madagascariensis]